MEARRRAARLMKCGEIRRLWQVLEIKGLYMLALLMSTDSWGQLFILHPRWMALQMAL